MEGLQGDTWFLGGCEGCWVMRWGSRKTGVSQRDDEGLGGSSQEISGHF